MTGMFASQNCRRGVDTQRAYGSEQACIPKDGASSLLCIWRPPGYDATDERSFMTIVVVKAQETKNYNSPCDSMRRVN